MRLFAGNSTDENKSIADWILKIGDGTIGNIINDEEHEIHIDDDILINNVVDPIQSIVDNTYPQFINNRHNHEYFRDRAILSPKLDDVAHVNDYMLGLLPGSGIPYHTLKLKIGAPIMLLRNIDRSMGLCNGTRLILTRMCDHVIEACIMSERDEWLEAASILLDRALRWRVDHVLGAFDCERRSHWNDATWLGGAVDGGFLEPEQLPLLEHKPLATLRR
ncbi:helicase-like protein [Senna tora]|uniref:Helicase-like protein n=1 Tax=Senna tora TaxID=362788 RepID=A0A834TRY8_9FABA|nr:helicase-like protein [Senna tora]